MNFYRMLRILIDYENERTHRAFARAIFGGGSTPIRFRVKKCRSFVNYQIKRNFNRREPK